MSGKRGRKSRAGKREPNGRLSRRLEDQAVEALALNSQRDLEQRQTLATGVAARVRVHGVKMETAVDQMAGSYVGRLRMAGKLDDPRNHALANARYLAAETFAAERENWYRAMGGPREPGAVDLNATKGGSGYENVERARHVLDLYRASCDAIEARQREYHIVTPVAGPLTVALQAIVIEDNEAPHMVPDLITALDVLAAHYGLLKAARRPAKHKEAA